MLDPRGLADQAERFRNERAARERHYRRVWGRLQRVNRAMAEAEEWEANEEMPADLRRELRPPLLTYDQLKALRAMLLDVLGELGER